MQKILMLLAFVIIGLGTFAQVQRKAAITNETISTTVNEPAGAKEGFAKKKDKRKILKELNLSKKQKLRLKEIQQSNQSKRDEIMNNDALTEDQKQDKLKEIKKAAALDLQGILSDEQKARMKAIREENKKSLGTKNKN